MIPRKSLLILTLFMLFLLGCSTHLHKPEKKLPSNSTYTIGSFWNYTETPMAGLRASSIVEGVLSTKNIKLHAQIEGSDEMGQSISKADFLQQQKTSAKASGSDYLITGEVQEWRYKTGIDGEPVVSYSLKIIKLNDDSIAFNGVGAKSGWGHKSIGEVAQEIAQELIPSFAP